MARTYQAVITDHAKDRASERCGIGKSDSKTKRMINNALTRGYGKDQLKGALQRYVMGAYALYGHGNNIKIYAGYVWVFQGLTLITVFGLPGRYQKDINNYVVKDLSVPKTKRYTLANVIG